MEYYLSTVLKHSLIAEDVWILKLASEGESVRPGQFYMLKAWNDELTLQRPISVYKRNANSLEFMYRVVGKGTEKLSRLKRGDSVELLGPLGNGFPVETLQGNIALVGGGIGVPPMYETAKYLKKKKQHVDCYFGYKEEPFGFEDFDKVADDIYITTESGVEGVEGLITKLLNVALYDAVLCCGPEPMMFAILKLCREKNIPCWLSMEKHMACGIGACLVCNCETHTGMKRACKDGPVFNGTELIIK